MTATGQILIPAAVEQLLAAVAAADPGAILRALRRIEGVAADLPPDAASAALVQDGLAAISRAEAICASRVAKTPKASGGQDFRAQRAQALYSSLAGRSHG